MNMSVRRNATLSAALLAALLAAPATALADQDADHDADHPITARVLQLEAQVRALTERLSALERAGAAQHTAASAEAQPGVADSGVVWLIDDYIGNSPFRVSHKEFNAAQGRIELLLQVTAPLNDPAPWSTPGARVPVAVTLRGADGEQARQHFMLGRGTRTEPGSHLHLYADIDPASAAAARQLVVEHAPDQ